MGLVLACLVGGVAIAAYFGVRTGRISVLQLQMQLSSTTSVSVHNLADDPVTVRLTQLDGAEGPSEWESERLEPFDSGSYGRIPTGRLEVAFTTSGAPPSQTCTLQTSRGDAFLFVIVPEGIAVVEEGGSPQSGDALRVDRSVLCQ